MPRSRHRKLRFPLAGLDRRYGFQDQRPFTTVAALNVRSDGAIEGRERGGSRPGLETVFVLPPGDGSLGAVRMLAEMNISAASRGPAYWVDAFNSGILEPHWEAAAWMAPDAVFGMTGDYLWARTFTEFKPAAWLAPRIVFDTSQEYTVKLWCRTIDRQGDQSRTAHGKSFLYLLLDAEPAASPYTDSSRPDKGVLVELERNSPNQGPNTFRLTIELLGSVLTDTIEGEADWSAWGPLEVLVHPDGLIEVAVERKPHLGEGFPISINVGDLSQFGTRTGIGLQTFDWVNGLAQTQVTSVAITYMPFFPPDAGRSIIFIAGSETAGRHIVYYERAPDRLGAILPSGGVTFHARLLRTASYNQHLFIADHGRITNAQGILVDVEPKVVKHFGGDWRLDFWESTDAQYPVPSLNRLIARWHDRIVLASREDTPHLFFMSERTNPYNWDFSVWQATQHPDAAYAGQAGDGGEIGEPITALVPYSNDYLIFGCINSIWIMRGDITFGGVIDNISHSIGFTSQEAWCSTPTGDIVFLSADGLYVLSPGTGQFPQSISRERLPNALLDLNVASTAITLVYDIEARGVHIFLSPYDATGARGSHWWFDWETKGFWPIELEDAHAPMVALQRQSSNAAYPSGAFMGCRDGGVRLFKGYADRDDGLAFASHVMYGPIPISGNDYEDGLLTELVGTLAEGSSDVEWSAHVGTSPEAASRAPAFDGGTWHAGVNHANHPRARGNAFYLKIQGKGTKWAMESIDATTMKTGKQRLP